MKQTNRFWKFIIFIFLTTLVVISSILVFLWQDLTPDQIQAIFSIAAQHSEYFFCILFISAIVLYTVLEVIYTTYIKPLKKISAEAAVIYASNPSHRIEIAGNKDIKNLAAVINNFADLFENLNKNITQQILAARKETEKERNLLAAIMSELPQGVFICNKNGRIILFNSLAKKIFTQDTPASTTEQFIGLGRSIYHLIDQDRLTQAIKEINERLASGAKNSAAYFITPIATGHVISIETIPVLDLEKQITGFILAIVDISDNIHQYDATLYALQTFREKIKRQQNTDLTEHYDTLMGAVLDTMLSKIPLSRISVSELLFSLKLKLHSLHDIELDILNVSHEDHIQADSYSLTTAFAFIFKRLSDLNHQKQFTICAVKKEARLILEITWQAETISQKQIYSFLDSKMETLPSPAYIFRQNNTDVELICNDQNQCSQINITAKAQQPSTVIKKHRAPVITGSRPEFYDFNLFRKEDINIDLMETRLDDLTYTVFDTETTGLNPDHGDEIISIAAVRIVNGKIAYQDIFDQLVDPKRDIPIESYKIHGINYEMVEGKRDINAILPVFKKFTSQTVLVGHNIAFDMKMLKIKEIPTGIKFLNPVLDTLLLSAVLHPIHEQHDLENIAKRLGVSIVGRHTALGDTMATAQIFLKLLPILEDNGILTLKDAISASRKSYYARLKY